ncbi:MAG: hypothetical protein ACYCV0_00305 [Desulfitobacteriaceae bacterium]
MIRIFFILLSSFLLAGCGPTPLSSEEVTAPPQQPATTISLLQQVSKSAHNSALSGLIDSKLRASDPGKYEDSCLNCHSATKLLDNPKAKLVDFLPGGKYNSQTEGITCRVCHDLGGAEMFNLKYGGWDACGRCHTSSTIALGQEVKHPQYNMVKGTGVGEVPSMPSLKYRLGDKFACYDCHLTDNRHHSFFGPGTVVSDTGYGNTRMNDKEFKTLLQTERCKICHLDANRTIEQLARHREEIEQQLSELRLINYEWGEKISNLDPKDPRVTAYYQGRTYFTYVDADGSKGAHNYELTKALLDQAQVKFNVLK